MPGIVGLITRMPRALAERQLLRMVAALHREPFYATGTWIDEPAGVYVGWSVAKGSFADGMPLRSERGDQVLVFSGEDFPEPGTARRLKEQGHDLSLDGAGYLVHLAEESPSFLQDLNGRFHGLLVDRTRRRATLFNDRYGMHRLYFHESADSFYFAGEAKAILAVRPELRTLNLQSLGELLSCGCVLENRSLFNRVEVLPGAAAWTFREGSLESKAAYFDPREWEDQPLLGSEEYYQELRRVFARNLPRYLEGPEQVGMSLTGGLDTRMIMAYQTAAPGALPGYTWGSMYRDCQDVRVAKQVSAVCQQPHQVITAGKSFLDQFSHYAERSVYLTDGCVEVGRCADLYVNEQARQIAPVRLTGLYGSEVLRRVRAFKPVDLMPGLFSPEMTPHVQAARRTYAKTISGHPLSFAVFRQAPWHHYPSLALEQSQVAMRSPFLDNDLVRTVFRAPESSCTSNDVCLRLISDQSPALGRIPTDRGFGGTRTGWPARASRGFNEFLFKSEYAYDYGMPQAVAQVDHLLSPLHLERIFLGRHKAFHYRVWYRDWAADYVRSTLLDAKSLSRPHVDRKTLESVVNGHLTGNRNYTLELHKLLTLELVHRLFIDAQEGDAQVQVRSA